MIRREGTLGQREAGKLKAQEGGSVRRRDEGGNEKEDKIREEEMGPAPVFLWENYLEGPHR